MNKESLKKAIEEQFPGQYNDGELGDSFISRLNDLTPPIKSELEYLLKTGKLAEKQIEVEGYSACKLITEHGMHPVGAYATLGWLTREPEKAKDAILRPHDKVVFNNPE